MRKRLFDGLTAGLGLLLLSPLMAALALLIWWRMGSPVFFQQLRPGLGGRPFQLIKFRSMALRLDASGQPLPDAQRLTGLGRFLRASSLDELPQLWCVLKGEMSLVGPRPLLMEYLPLYTPEQARRHALRPGLTGWAQINGRNALSWQQKFAFDLWYIDNQSLWLDLKIIALTLLRVVQHQGIRAPAAARAEKFSGNPP